LNVNLIFRWCLMFNKRDWWVYFLKTKSMVFFLKIIQFFIFSKRYLRITHRTDVPQSVFLYDVSWQVCGEVNNISWQVFGEVNDISWQVCGEVTAWQSQLSHAVTSPLLKLHWNVFQCNLWRLIFYSIDLKKFVFCCFLCS